MKKQTANQRDNAQQESWQKATARRYGYRLVRKARGIPDLDVRDFLDMPGRYELHDDDGGIVDGSEHWSLYEVKKFLDRKVSWNALGECVRERHRLVRERHEQREWLSEEYAATDAQMDAFEADVLAELAEEEAEEQAEERPGDPMDAADPMEGPGR